MLEAQNMEMRKSDSNCLAFMAGVSLVLLLVSAFLMVLPTTDKDWDTLKQQIFSTILIYRFAFMFIYVPAAAGVAVQIWTKYNINYLFILDMNPATKMTHW